MGFVHKFSQSRLAILFLLAAILSMSCLCSPAGILEPAPTESIEQSTIGLPTTESFSPQKTILPTNLPGPEPTSQLEPPPPENPIINPDQSAVSYNIDQNIILENTGPGAASRVVIWVAQIRTISPYQEVIVKEISPLSYQEVTDEYGNSYAEIEITDLAANSSSEINIHYVVKVAPVDSDLGQCIATDDLNNEHIPTTFTSPETYIESDEVLITNLSSDLSSGSSTTCDQSAAFYDYVTENMQYAGYNPGDSGALIAAETLQGDCTEFSDLTIALHRASNIPARFIEGITCCTYSGYEDGENKHNWMEVNLPGIGWVPMDPTWGRLGGQHDTYFAGMTPDHIIVTQGRNLSRLNGYHYYYYRYWWNDEDANIDSTEIWNIVHAD